MQSQQPKSAATTTAKPFKPGRRPRIPLSCDPCRSRKLKCNREQPCQNCSVRAEQSLCRYRGYKPGSGLSPSHEHEHADAMQQRIARLESLVKSLVAQGQGTLALDHHTPPDDAVLDHTLLETGYGTTDKVNDVASLSYKGGTTEIDERHSVYKAANDWSDVLQELDALKAVWNESQDGPVDHDVLRTPSYTVDGSSFLSGYAKKTEMSELLAALPPKSEVDKLVHQFFDRTNFPIPVAPILHEPTFMREYTEHWRDPSRTSVIWLGLLFSILGITILSYHQFDNEPPEYEDETVKLCELYRERTAQCLMAGDIGKCLPYTLETLLFNSTAELGREDDNGRGLWLMTGLMVRTAMNMGYHRDPSHTPSISILKGEMRRRVWLGLRGKDELASFLVGFPSMMPAVDSDTQEPGNLHDWELSEDTAVLPHSRPLAEATPITYLIVKNRLTRALGRVTDFNNSLSQGSYDEVLEIDSSLYKVLNEVPFHIKTQSGRKDPSQSQSKSTKSVSMLQMEFLYHRGMCSLHRKFLAKGRVDSRYSLSRDRCISSALAALDQQQAAQQATRSELPSYMPHWYKIAPARQFFILAAMILCLDLEHRRRNIYTDADPEYDAMLCALERSCEVWKDVQGTSDEARRIYHVLAGMVSSFQPHAGTGSSHVQLQAPDAALHELDQPFQWIDDVPSLGEQSLGTNDMEMDIDWATWDSFIEGASFEDSFLEIPFIDNSLPEF